MGGRMGERKGERDHDGADGFLNVLTYPTSSSREP